MINLKPPDYLPAQIKLCNSGLPFLCTEPKAPPASRKSRSGGELNRHPPGELFSSPPTVHVLLGVCGEDGIGELSGPSNAVESGWVEATQPVTSRIPWNLLNKNAWESPTLTTIKAKRLTGIFGCPWLGDWSGPESECVLIDVDEDVPELNLGDWQGENVKLVSSTGRTRATQRVVRPVVQATIRSWAEERVSNSSWAASCRGGLSRSDETLKVSHQHKNSEGHSLFFSLHKNGEDIFL